ncbi:hypothetical protein [Psychromonas sp. MME2]|uniref:hypothetical protein n=1 Tax=unclassified Psychromonas TaxID=2614957 RepID=UPI00339BE823
MPYLTRVNTTQEVDLEIDLIELAYNHVDSIQDLETLLEGISSHTVEQYKDSLKEKSKEEIYDNITCTQKLAEFIDNIADSITDDYRQNIIDEEINKRPVDIVDATCSATDDELQDLLICILNQHPKALHQFLTSQHKVVKLAMIESAQALLKELEDYF